jgi:glucose-6-phosphate 1-dehydrogenase
MIDGKQVPAYRQEPDVNPKSNTETFAAIKFFIDNWRWADVPFYLRSGKHLANKVSEIAIRFKDIPHRLFGEGSDEIEHNMLVMKIQPEEGVSLRFSAKVPGPRMHIRSVSMDFNYGTGFGVVSPPAYERLIGDAMRGDATLFTRWDAVEAAWIAVMPILERWLVLKDTSFPNYAAGSQGPIQADAILEEDDSWRRI